MSGKKFYPLLLMILIFPKLFGLTFGELEKKAGTKEYYAIKMYNSTIGYSQVEYSSLDYKDSRAVQISTMATSQMLKGGTLLSVTLFTTAVFDEHFNLLRFTYTNKERDTGFSCAVEKNRLFFYDREGKQTGSFTYKPGIEFADFLTRAIPDSLEAGEEVTLDFYTIDTEQQALIIDKRTITYLGPENLETGKAEYKTKKYRIRVHKKQDSSVYELWVDPNSRQVIGELHDSTMHFVLSPGKKPPSIVPFTIDNYDRINADQKIIPSPGITTMTVDLKSSSIWREDFFPGTPTQEVLHRSDTKVSLRLSRSYNRIPHNLIKVTVPEEYRQYTGHTAGIQSDHRLIREKAREIVGTEKRIRFQLLKLMQWIKQNLTYSDSSAELNSTGILETKAGDCSEYSNLLVAFLRSLDIPARQVNGLKYIGRGIFGFHSWAQVYTGSWITVDPVEADFPGPYLIEIPINSLLDTTNTTIDITGYTIGNKTFKPK